MTSSAKLFCNRGVCNEINISRESSRLSFTPCSSHNISINRKVERFLSQQRTLSDDLWVSNTDVIDQLSVEWDRAIEEKAFSKSVFIRPLRCAFGCAHFRCVSQKTLLSHQSAKATAFQVSLNLFDCSWSGEFVSTKHCHKPKSLCHVESSRDCRHVIKTWRFGFEDLASEVDFIGDGHLHGTEQEEFWSMMDLTLRRLASSEDAI